MMLQKLYKITLIPQIEPSLTEKNRNSYECHQNVFLNVGKEPVETQYFVDGLSY